MYFEVVPFIPITLLVLIHMVLSAIKVIGPLPRIPEKKEEISQAVGVSFFGLITGFWILLIQIITLVSLASKPQFTPTYIIDSNRLLFTILIIFICLWMIAESFLAPSKWHLIVFAAIMILCSFFYLALLFWTSIDALTFLIDSLLITVLTGIISWVVLVVGVKKFKNKREKWLHPIYNAPERVVKIFLSPKIELCLLIILGIFFMLSWADIPLI